MRDSHLPNLHLSPDNFEIRQIILPLHPAFFPDATDGKLLCEGFVGEAEAGTFNDLHGSTTFVLTSEGKIWFELQLIGHFEVATYVKVYLRGGKIEIEPAPLPDRSQAEA